MTTAVASPSSFQSLPKLSWNGSNINQGSFSAMSSEDVSRMFMPQRKVLSRSSSNSSLASNSSASSTSTVTQIAEQPHPTNGANADAAGAAAAAQAKKKQRGGFWPSVSKAESTTGVTNARASGAVQQANPHALGLKNGLQSATPNTNGVNAAGMRNTNGVAGSEGSALLVLLPMNGTFERKQISVPFFPDVLKIGRQTNAKTVPTPINGYFDSKVLSRQHAEIWAEKNGKIWIRDVKSSNGTFVNGQRLSPENRESEPHELRQHDSLELGIDIVSEDQKTVVHHKVSAKVEYAGLPGSSNNVLDLSFGDLDPSQGNTMMGQSMSAPMMHSRNQPGRPPTIRSTTAVSLASSQMNSVAQQRQANYWGSPLNVEQLVKQLSLEMRAAKQQSQDLEQANSYLHAAVPESGSPTKPPSAKDNSQSRMATGRAKPPRVDHAARFADPPAPPPQQPLPEKPDSVKAPSPGGLLKRENTAKPSNMTNGQITSPTSGQSGQIRSLVEALSIAKKEIDQQGTRVKQLEEMLNQERLAREAAEERARQIEETAAAQPPTTTEKNVEPVETSPITETSPPVREKSVSEDEELLKQRLDAMIQEMQRMKSDMEQVTKRAETAEADANSARMSLAEMIEQLKQESSRAEKSTHEEVAADPLANADAAEESPGSKTSRRSSMSGSNGSTNATRGKHAGQSNGHVRGPRLPEHLERAMTTVLRENHRGGDLTAQSAPYVSMLGVVLIGVGLMAYLNSWQKADK